MTNIRAARDWLILIPVGVVFFALSSFIGGGKSYALAATILVFYVVVSEKWDSRKNRNFWVTISMFAVVHAIGIWLINFSEEIRPGLIGLPFMFADGMAMWGVLIWIGKRGPHGTDRP